MRDIAFVGPGKVAALAIAFVADQAEDDAQMQRDRRQKKFALKNQRVTMILNHRMRVGNIGRPGARRALSALEERPAVDTFERRAPATNYDTRAGKIAPAQRTVAPLHSIYAGMSRTNSINLSELIS